MSDNRPNATAPQATRRTAPTARITANARRATWMAARARNAARRGGLIAAVGALAVIASVVVLVMLPREAERRVKAALDAIPAAIDTVVLQQQLDHARAVEQQVIAQVAAANADSVASIESAARPLAATAAGATIGDSSAASDPDRTDLMRQVAHARDAPLVESYRALGETRLLRSDVRTRAILDSIEQVNREREAFAALGGPDARFAALSARLEVLGRRLIRLAEQQLNVSLPVRARPDSQVDAVPPAVRFTRDTLTHRNARVVATAAHDSVTMAEQSMLRARQWNVDVGRRQALARAKATMHVPLAAMLAAALVLGLAVGYAAAFLLEIRFPKVADITEVERITQARVIVHGHLGRRPRRRRRTDGLPPVLDEESEAYQLLHLTLTGLGDGARSVRVASATPLLAATVGINLAAAATRESRATLLIDADLRAKLAALLLRAPGRSVSSKSIEHPGAADGFVIRVPTDLHHALDLLPLSSVPVAAVTGERPEFGDQLKQLAARYDLTVVLTSGETSLEALLPTTDVILCAQLGTTPLAWLTRASGHLQARQSRLRAVLVWDAPAPTIS